MCAERKRKQNNCCKRIDFGAMHFPPTEPGADAFKLFKHTQIASTAASNRETQKSQIIYGKNANANGSRNTFPSLHANRRASSQPASQHSRRSTQTSGCSGDINTTIMHIRYICVCNVWVHATPFRVHTRHIAALEHRTHCVDCVNSGAEYLV